MRHNNVDFWSLDNETSWIWPASISESEPINSVARLVKCQCSLLRWLTEPRETKILPLSPFHSPTDSSMSLQFLTWCHNNVCCMMDNCHDDNLTINSVWADVTAGTLPLVTLSGTNLCLSDQLVTELRSNTCWYPTGRQVQVICSISKYLMVLYLTFFFVSTWISVCVDWFSTSIQIESRDL